MTFKVCAPQFLPAEWQCFCATITKCLSVGECWVSVNNFKECVLDRHCVS